MARLPSIKLGIGPCPSCGHLVTFRHTAGGVLTHRCDACDSSGYAEAGGKAFKARLPTIKLATIHDPHGGIHDQPKQDGEPITKVEPVEPQKPLRNSVFDISKL